MRERLNLSRAIGLIASVFVLALGLAAKASVAADGKNAEAIVDSLQKNYDTTTDFTADFQQETEVKNINRTLKASGKLSFKRPGKMLWNYDEPKGQFVIADGKFPASPSPSMKRAAAKPSTPLASA